MSGPGKVILNWKLKEACKEGNLYDVVRFIQNGADVNAKGVLIIDPWTALHFASEQGHLGIVKYLIKKGSTVDTKDICDWTPLHMASKNGHLDVVKYLCKTGADSEEKTLDCRTPLDIALINGHRNVVNYLKRKNSFTSKSVRGNCTET